MTPVYTNVLTYVRTPCNDYVMNTTTDTRTGYLCKSCGAESPRGIGYAASAGYDYPAPAASCPNRHVEDGK